MAGKLVFEGALSSQEQQSIDLSNLPKGNYILKTEVVGKVNSRKIVLE